MDIATSDERKQLATLLEKSKLGLITTTNSDGRLVSRPMAVKDREFDGDLWFFTEDPSHKTDEVRGNPQVNVALDSRKGWVSISGEAEVVRDEAKIDELWDTGAEAWFTEGRTDPKVALLKVTAHSAELWAQDAPTPVVLLKYARAAIGGGRPDVGEAKTIDLTD